jgi:hypothetical protein
MPMSADQAADFATFARRPETWASAARRNLAVADHLFRHKDALVSMPQVSFDERSGTHYAAYLHAGLAVENAGKAAMVYLDPTVITDLGGLDRAKLGPNGGHGLKSIAAAVLLNLSSEDELLLEKLQEHVLWAGRYAIPIKADVLFDGDRMDNLRVAPADERIRIHSLVSRLLSVSGSRG